MTVYIYPNPEAPAPPVGSAGLHRRRPCGRCGCSKAPHQVSVSRAQIQLQVSQIVHPDFHSVGVTSFKKKSGEFCRVWFNQVTPRVWKSLGVSQAAHILTPTSRKQHRPVLYRTRESESTASFLTHL